MSLFVLFDDYHDTGHWDYNPWDTYNSKWQNVPLKPGAGPNPGGAGGASVGGGTALGCALGAVILGGAAAAIAGSAHALDTETLMSSEYQRAMAKFGRPNPLWLQRKQEQDRRRLEEQKLRNINGRPCESSPGLPFNDGTAIA